MNQQGWIKLHRTFLDWEWLQNSNVVSLFLICLLSTNHEDNKWQGTIVKKGSFITSLTHLAKKAGLSVMQTRTALNKLKLTGELTVKHTNKYSVIMVNKWIDYQLGNSQVNTQITGKQQADNRQITTNNNDKNDNKEKKYINNGASPKIDINSMKQQLAEKLSYKNNVGINHQWQSEAFRIATNLNIELSPEYKARWLKLFKNAFFNNARSNIYRAYSFLSDYPKPLSSTDKVKLFFWRYANPTAKYK